MRVNTEAKKSLNSSVDIAEAACLACVNRPTARVAFQNDSLLAAHILFKKLALRCLHVVRAITSSLSSEEIKEKAWSLSSIKILRDDVIHSGSEDLIRIVFRGKNKLTQSFTISRKSGVESSR